MPLTLDISKLCTKEIVSFFPTIKKTRSSSLLSLSSLVVQQCQPFSGYCRAPQQSLDPKRIHSSFHLGCSPLIKFSKSSGLKALLLGVAAFSSFSDFLDKQDSNGDTALHLAIKLDGQSTLRQSTDESSRYKICQLLLEKGANPNIPDYRGVMPLTTALLSDNRPMINLLIKYGAKE